MKDLDHVGEDQIRPGDAAGKIVDSSSRIHFAVVEPDLSGFGRRVNSLYRGSSSSMA